MVAGVAPYFFAESDGGRAVVLTIVAAFSLLLCLAFDTDAVLSLGSPTQTGLVCCLLLLAIVSYGSLRAIDAENDRYYLAADLFHWLVELFTVALITRITLQGSPATSARVLISGCFITAVVTSCLIAGCYAGVVKGGGYFQGGSRFWHLKAGILFPQIPLMIVICAAYNCREMGLFWKRMAWLTAALCTVMLILTLKRTMWLSSVGTLFCVLMPNRSFRRFGLVAALICIAASAIFVTLGSEVFGYLNFMTYNENYSVEDTMEDRENQLKDAVRLFSLAGEGFGAEVEIYEVGTNKVERIHYIHSLYAYQIVQLGIPLVSFCLLFIVWMIQQLQARDREGLPLDWRIAAALACVVGISLNGVTLVSIHSAFAGIAFGLALTALGEPQRWTVVNYLNDDEYDEEAGQS